MKIINAKIFTEQCQFTIGDIDIGNDRICNVKTQRSSQINESKSDANAMSVVENQQTNNNEVINAKGAYVIPGLVDIHFHGACGYDFCDGTHEAVQALADYNAKNGILAICPATMTYTEDILMPIMKAAADHNNDAGADLVGINMEGPFISPNKVGAQNPDYVLRADLDMLKRLDEASGGLIKIVDVAPEEPGCLSFIKSAAKDFNISIAHTCTDYETAVAAFDAGARHMTHLYNAMNPIHHRQPGPIVAAHEYDAEVELISDGHHVHPASMRLIYDLFSSNKVIIIDDCCRATGAEEGKEYDLGGQMIIAKDGVAYLAEQPDTIAASATNMMDCLRYSVLTAGIPLEQAVQSSTINPAKSIGVDKDYGSISKGKIANLVILDDNLEIQKVIRHGQVL